MRQEENINDDQFKKKNISSNNINYNKIYDNMSNYKNSNNTKINNDIRDK